MVYIVRTFLILLITSVSLAAGEQANRKAPFEIKTMKAMLFYEDRGTFSQDVIELNPETPFTLPRLWNMYMKGSSENEGPATSVLVTVEVTGEALSYKPRRKLEFIARYRTLDGGPQEITVRRRSDIRITERGKYIAGFWLYDVGCHPVKLSARIIGQRKTSVMRGRINIGCGE